MSVGSGPFRMVWLAANGLLVWESLSDGLAACSSPPPATVTLRDTIADSLVTATTITLSI